MSIELLEKAEGDNLVHVAVIENPFDPNRVTHYVAKLEAPQTLVALIPQRYDDVIISLNGQIVAPLLFDATWVRPGDYIVACPILTGGGDSKSILRIAAMIAIAAFAPGAGAMLANAAGFGSAAAWGAVVTVAGGMLVNAILPPAPLTTPSVETFGSASYSADGQKNTATQTAIVPVVYGECRIAPNRVGFRTENIDQRTQDLFMLYSLSEGPIEGIAAAIPDGAYKAKPLPYLGTMPMVNEFPLVDTARIWIDDQPLENFPNTEARAYLTLGTQDQDTPHYFEEGAALPVARSTRLDTTNWVTFTTSQEVDSFELEVTAPTGLIWYQGKKYTANDLRVDFDIQYRKVGATDWVTMYDPDSTIMSSAARRIRYFSGATSTTLGAGQVIKWGAKDYLGNFPNTASSLDDVPYEFLGQVWTTGPGIGQHLGDLEHVLGEIHDLPHIADKSETPVRKTLRSPALPKATYEIRLKKRGTYSPGFEKMCVDKIQIGGWIAIAGVALLGAEEGFVSTAGKPFRVAGDYGITTNRYDAIKRVVEDIDWSESTEVVAGSVSYVNTAMLSMKLRLTERLNHVPTITVQVRGRQVKVWSLDANFNYQYTTQWSNNPAWVAWDILTDTRIGAGISESRLDLAKWLEWASYCEAQGLQFNAIFQSPGNVWDALQYVMRAGHAQLVTYGTRYTLAIERADTPVMMFNVGNIVQKSLRIQWLPRDDRVNEVEVVYYDSADDYKRSTLVVRDPNASNDPRQRVHRLEGYWITNKDQATKEANFELNSNRLINHIVTFDAPVEAIACRVGDQILLQHDVPAWGQGGRLDAGSTPNVLKLDRPVTMVAGRDYKILLQADSIQRYSGTVAQRPGNGSGSYTGSVVYLNGFDGVNPVRRLVIAGVDYEVNEVLLSGSLYAARLSKVVTVTVGAAYQLWDTDYIDEHAVSLSVGDSTEVTVTAPLTSPPTQFTKWMFGEVAKVKRPYRIKSVSGSGHEVRTITASEYNADIYDLENVVVEAPIQPTYPISHVRNLTAALLYDLIDTVYRPRVTVSWDKPADGSYVGADVYAARNGQTFEKVGEVRQGLTTFQDLGTSAEDYLIYKAVAVDAVGNTAGLVDAPQAGIAVTADSTAPGLVTNVALTSQINSLNLTWTRPDDDDFKAVKIYRGTTNVFAEAVLHAQVDADAFVDYPPTAATYYYWLTAVDFIGNESEVHAAGGISGAYRSVQSSDIAPGAIEEAAFPEDLQPVKLVSSLPNPAGYVGPQVVFNTTDRKLYRYNSAASSWTAEVPTTDLSGQISAAQIVDEAINLTKFASGLRPVEIVAELPATGNFDGRVVYLTTDGKLYRYSGSAFTADVAAEDLSGQVQGGQIAAEAIDATKFASGIEPVAMVSSLPSPSGYTGPKVVLNTSDGKVYRHTGSAWTTAVAAADLTGQVNTSQIANAAVDDTKIAAAAVKANKLAVRVHVIY